MIKNAEVRVDLHMIRVQEGLEVTEVSVAIEFFKIRKDELLCIYLLVPV